MNIPNILTVFRMVLIPFFVIAYYIPSPTASMVAAIIFAIAGATDFFDGMLARVLNQTSLFGAFLDPVADKLMVSTALVLLVSDSHLHYLALGATIIVGREIVISALREWMAEVGKRASLAVTFISKIKTCAQMLAIFVLLIYQAKPDIYLLMLGYISLYVAAIFTLWTMIMYIKTAWSDLPFIEISKKT